jgi:hypothetical protein
MNYMQHKKTTPRTLAALVLVSACSYLGLAAVGSAAPQQAPVNTTAPTITGTPRLGTTLTAQNGTWENNPTAFQYRWQRCGATGVVCLNIPGASEKTYMPVAADVGHTMRVRVTAVNADGAANARSAPTAVVSSAAPRNTAPPTITGTPRLGTTLTAQNGTWENNPTAFQYQWLRCGTAGAGCVGIPGATEKTYTPVAADVGHTMRVRVTAVNADGATNARSAPTAVVSPSAAPKNTGRPTIAGVARIGEELTADEGSWSGNPVSFAHQWQRCDVDGSNCFDVAGATGKAYGVRLADLGYRLRVEVKARNSEGIGTATSALTAIVAPTTRITNRRPTLRIVSIRFFGPRIYARFRVCDDSFKNLTILQTDSRPRRLSYTRRFATLIAPRPCGVYTRNWIPAPRFRGPGRYTLTLRARDKSRFTSIPARRTFVR